MSTSTARQIRWSIERNFLLMTESVSKWGGKYHQDYPTNEQIAVVLPRSNDESRAVNEERLLDLLTTPSCPLVEIGRTPTRVFLAII